MPGVTNAYPALAEHDLPSTEGHTLTNDISYQSPVLPDLPPCDVHVVKRVSIGEPEQTPRAEFNSELVYFSDGAIQELTRGTPNTSWHGDNIPPFAINGGDALGTGPLGINRTSIKYLAEELGYHVEWLHHQGRHAEIPRSLTAIKRMGHFLFGKSVGRSAHHQHALFDHLGNYGGALYDTSQLLSAGDSRQAETGEAFDAVAAFFNHKVLFSDYTANCFHHKPELKDVPDLLLTPIREGWSLGRLALDKFIDVVRSGDPEHITKYCGTFDPHFMNLIHEAAWIWPLSCGDAGKNAEHVPLDAVGVRTLLADDKMSQPAAWIKEHAKRPNIRVILKPGTHIDLVRQQQDRFDRFERLSQKLREHAFSISDISYEEMDWVIYGPEGYPQAA